MRLNSMPFSKSFYHRPYYISYYLFKDFTNYTGDKRWKIDDDNSQAVRSFTPLTLTSFLLTLHTHTSLTAMLLHYFWHSSVVQMCKRSLGIP